jgi:hypothetical protein
MFANPLSSTEIPSGRDHIRRILRVGIIGLGEIAQVRARFEELTGAARQRG